MIKSQIHSTSLYARWAIPVLLAAALLVTACGGTSSTPVTNSSGIPTNAPVVVNSTVKVTPAADVAAPTVPQTEPTTLAAQPAQAPTNQVAVQPPVVSAGDLPAALTSAMRGFRNVKSFRTKRTSIGGDVNSTISVDVILPDSFHATTDMNGKTSEVIGVSGTYYFKNGQVPWKSVPQASASSFAAMASAFTPDDKQISALMLTVTDFKSLGPDVVDGTPTLVYQFTTTITEPPATGTTKMWVGAADGLLRKTEGDSTVTINGQTSDVKTTALYYDYNADFQIDAPVQ